MDKITVFLCALQARASQAHALLLAEVRAGTRWWRHLRSLNHEDVQLSLMQDNADQWHALDQQWRRQWQAIEAEDAARAAMEPSFAKRGKAPPLSDVAVTEDQDRERRGARRAEEDEAAMRAAMQRAGIKPPPPLQRPGSAPILIPTTTTAAAAAQTPAVAVAHADAQTVSSGHPSVELVFPAAAAGKPIDVKKDPQPVAEAPLVKQGEQPRPPPRPSTATSVGSAALDLRHERGGGGATEGGSGRGKVAPEAEDAVGEAVLDGLRRQASLLQERASAARDVPPAVGSAVLEMMQPPQQGGGRRDASPAEKAAVGVAVLDDLQQRQNDQRQKEAAAAADVRARLGQESGGRLRAPPAVEMAVGSAYLDSLGQPGGQSPLVAMGVGSAVLDTLEDQERLVRGGV